MRIWIIAFLLGILSVLQLQTLPPPWLSAVLLCIAIVITVFCTPRYRWIGGFLSGSFWAIVCASIILADELPVDLEGKTLIVEGRIVSLVCASIILADELPVDLEGKTLIVEGRIVSLPEYRGRGVRFEFEIKKLINTEGLENNGPGKVRLNWFQDAPELIPGQVWRLPVRLKRPHGFMNPGGFDYEGWLFQHRIRATGYVVKDVHNTTAGVMQGQWINRLRYHLRTGLIKRLEENRYTGLVLALSLGDRSLITPGANAVMIRTGTSHLLAISGLHISLVAALFFVLVRRLWSLAGRLPLYVPAPRAAVVAAILAAVGYSLLAGMSIPTQRSMIMITVVMLGILGHRQYPISTVLCAALFVVLLVDPYAVMDPGFWLSFTAVAVIVYGMSNRIDTDNIWWKWGRAQYLVAIGLLPPLITLFGQYSLAGLLANFIAIPWISFITVPLAITGTVIPDSFASAANVCLQLAAASLGLLWPFMEGLSQPDLAVWKHAAPSHWALLMAMTGALILLLPRGFPARWIGLFWMLPLLMPPADRPEENEVWFTLLDVGQGLAAVVRTRQHTLVYDTGARFSESFNTGEAVVVPYLRRQQTDRIGSLVISHADNDHIGGADAVLAAWPDTPVMTSVPERFKHDQARFCMAGLTWRWEGVEFIFLHPDRPGPATENDLSCVLKVSTGNRSILLSGDIEKEAERQLLMSSRDQLTAHVLVAPHHGSKTSSTPEFINAVNPELVLFPVGYRNRFKFPNEAIIARYAARDIPMLDTARHGAIEIRMNTDGMTVLRHRQQARRFWHTDIH